MANSTHDGVRLLVVSTAIACAGTTAEEPDITGTNGLGSGVATLMVGDASAPATGSATTGATTAVAGTGTDTSDEHLLPFAPAGPDAAPDPAQMGPYPVGVTTTLLLDDSRIDARGQPRRLVTEIWYPAGEQARDQPGYVYTVHDLLTDDAIELLGEVPKLQLPTAAVRDATPRDGNERFPVILFSHGSSGVRMQSTFLTVYLASHGYVVAAPDHLGNTLSDTVLTGGADQQQHQLESIGFRTDDMGFVLEHLQTLGDSDPLGAIVDPERVGATGHSLGALTTLRMLAEGRPIDVAVAQAPPGYEYVWLGPLPHQPQEITIPTMLHAGDVDRTTPLAGAEDIFFRLNPPRSLLTLADAGHFTFSDMCTLGLDTIQFIADIGLSQSLEDGCTDEHIDPEVALPLQRHYAIGLFNGHLRNSPGSLALMTAAAGENLAPGEFELQYDP